MGFLGGDVLEIACTDPTLGSFRFSVKATEAFNLDVGGIRTSDDKAGITGSGQGIYTMNRQRWEFDGQVAVDFVSDNEMGGTDALSSSTNEQTWTISHISGYIGKGLGKIVGELKADTDKATLPLKIQGSGKLEKIGP
jgi:hypothetical protein